MVKNMSKMQQKKKENVLNSRAIATDKNAQGTIRNRPWMENCQLCNFCNNPIFLVPETNSPAALMNTMWLVECPKNNGLQALRIKKFF